LSDESNDFDDVKRMQINIQYDTPARGGSITHIRQRIRDIVHNHRYQIAVIILVLLDAAIVVATIIVDDASGKSRKSHTMEIVELVLHDFSLAILSLFMVEIIVKLFALGLSFFKHKLEVFDACVVIVSFSLDIVILHRNSDGALGGVEFIILLRLWRISRIVNGLIVSVKKKSEEKVEILSMQKQELDEQVLQLESKVAAQKKEIQHLREKLESLGVRPDDIPITG